MGGEISPPSSARSRVASQTFLTEDGGQAVWLGPQSRAGGMWLGAFSIHNTSEFPSAAAVCSLSQVLETEVAPKYFLSPRACAGIIRRAEKRGKALPAHLAAALKAVADLAPISSAMVA